MKPIAYPIYPTCRMIRTDLLLQADATSLFSRSKDRHLVNHTYFEPHLSRTMLRRAPPSFKGSDQNPTSATSGGFGIISKPFKAPTAAKRHVDLPSRKRKVVNYKDAGGDRDDAGDKNADPSGDGPGASKKVKYAMGNKEYGDDGVLGSLGAICMRKFPVFSVKEKTIVFGKT